MTGQTCGLSATFLAHERMILMASIEVSGKAALQANSERHFMASWNEAMEARKWFLNIRSGREREEGGGRGRREEGGGRRGREGEEGGREDNLSVRRRLE